MEYLLLVVVFVRSAGKRRKWGKIPISTFMETIFVSCRRNARELDRAWVRFFPIVYQIDGIILYGKCLCVCVCAGARDYCGHFYSTEYYSENIIVHHKYLIRFSRSVYLFSTLYLFSEIRILSLISMRSSLNSSAIKWKCSSSEISRFASFSFDEPFRPNFFFWGTFWSVTCCKAIEAYPLSTIWYRLFAFYGVYDHSEIMTK